MTDRYAAYTELKFDRPAERVLRITFDRPERLNAVSAKGHQELCDVWRDIDRDSSVNAVILCGKGRAFSAGGDFGLIEQLMERPDIRLQTWKEARDLVYNIINYSR